MATDISRSRLTLNALGCSVLVLICLPMCFWVATHLWSLPPPKPNDPDGGKAGAIFVMGMIICASIGIAALISLLRSVAKLRRLPSES